MATKSDSKSLNLALQGGGSHGAYTWGVLDRLLAEPTLKIDGISGTSSGAMNAVVMADGLLRGGRDGARQALREFWEQVASMFSDLFQPTAQLSDWLMFETGAPLSLQSYLALTQAFSPYQLNPMDHNPLRQLLEEMIDFGRLRRNRSLKLFIGATQVRTGKLKLFREKELSVDALLASACLPSLHHAITIDGEAYWDGGYAGNPPIFPLIFDCKTSDVMIVIVQPLARPELPTTAEAIRMRAAELSFNTAFLREMRAIAFSKDQIKQDLLPLGRLERQLSRLNVHLVQNEAMMQQLDPSSAYQSPPAFIEELYQEGYASCEAWLDNNRQHIGTQSSVNLSELFC
ncbi:NTE family protein [Methylohalomonas lacus]|uniref:NTE family protein n=1 Tax=Methylohalomonas lacus TaxID=398773 RepID=A0AAE3HMY0_9GAMM|nr:patatin-like phospholipase family protein [Methylohalomonas lacus]MCS3904117.1 NTE family protein [Methylohalomonas lacus]